MPRPTLAAIDLGALRNNARLLRALTPDQRCLAVVKADAYGHGAVPAALALEDLVDGFAVAFLDEATELRDAGITLPILVMEGPFSEAELPLFLELGIWPTIHQPEQLTWLLDSDYSAIEQIWVKFDTGMHRLGYPLERAADIYQSLSDKGYKTLVGMSHWADAEVEASAITARQLERFAQLSAIFDTTSINNSAGALAHLAEGSHWIRLGYGLYGGRPSDAFDTLPLHPVMTVKSTVIAIRNVSVGESVGYGGTWQADRDSRIATIPIGYADGYPRTARNDTPVAIDGVLCPLAGRVSMDMITVDVTDHPTATIGSPVTLWGDNPTIDQVAPWADTIGYELITRTPTRLRREWIHPKT